LVLLEETRLALVIVQLCGQEARYHC
jgi:hypothetical protein